MRAEPAVADASAQDAQHVHEWRYVRTVEDWFDGDEEDIYECSCGATERRYVAR